MQKGHISVVGYKYYKEMYIFSVELILILIRILGEVVMEEEIETNITIIIHLLPNHH